jgi:rod shape-determining protein MreD
VKVLWFSALALLLLSVESVLVKAIGLEVTRIDVGVAILVWVAVRGALVEGALTAFMVGYLLDVFTGRPTGLFPFLGVAVFLLTRAAALVVDGRTRATYGLLVAGATALHALLAVFFTWLTSSSDGRALSLQGVPVQTFLSVGAGQALWWLLKRIEAGERVEAKGALL